MALSAAAASAPSSVRGSALSPGDATANCRAFTTMRSSTSEEGFMAVELDARAAGARRLADKVCVVTGAGQGIGRAAARRLGQEGGKIVVADRIDASASRTLTELHEHGVDAQKVLLDLSTFAGAQSLM